MPVLAWRQDASSTSIPLMLGIIPRKEPDVQSPVSTKSASDRWLETRTLVLRADDTPKHAKCVHATLYLSIFPLPPTLPIQYSVPTQFPILFILAWWSFFWILNRVVIHLNTWVWSFNTLKILIDHEDEPLLIPITPVRSWPCIYTIVEVQRSESSLCRLLRAWDGSVLVAIEILFLEPIYYGFVWSVVFQHGRGL